MNLGQILDHVLALKALQAQARDALERRRGARQQRLLVRMHALEEIDDVCVAHAHATTRPRLAPGGRSDSALREGYTERRHVGQKAGHA